MILNGTNNSTKKFPYSYWIIHRLDLFTCFTNQPVLSAKRQQKSIQATNKDMNERLPCTTFLSLINSHRIKHREHAPLYRQDGILVALAMNSPMALENEVMLCSSLQGTKQLLDYPEQISRYSLLSFIIVSIW